MSHSPFLVRLVAASITAKQNQMLLAEVALLRVENAYLRDQLPEVHRFTFTNRWVRTVERECIRRCWFLGYQGLRRVLQKFVDHYNTERPISPWATGRWLGTPIAGHLRKNPSPHSRRAKFAA